MAGAFAKQPCRYLSCPPVAFGASHLVVRVQVPGIVLGVLAAVDVIVEIVIVAVATPDLHVALKFTVASKAKTVGRQFDRVSLTLGASAESIVIGFIVGGFHASQSISVSKSIA